MNNDMEDSEFKFEGNGLERGEKVWGGKRFKEYQRLYPHLHNLQSLQLLESLVFYEALQERFNSEAGEKHTKGNDIGKLKKISVQLQNQMKTNLEQILILKEKLKMFESKERLDAFNDIKQLFEKFEVWAEKNQGSRKVTCPFCSKMFILWMRTDMYEAKKHPYFEDKVLCNLKLHKMWKAGQISKEDYAEVLGTSPDYPQWLDINWYQPRYAEKPTE